MGQVKLWIWGILGSMVFGLAFGGWQASQFINRELASKTEVLVADARAQMALDLQIDDLMKRIAQIEAKPKKTAEDLRQINFLEGQLDRARKMRSIK